MVKPPRAALAGIRARSSTTYPSAGTKGKEKNVAQFTSDVEPSHDARESGFQGWQVPRSPVRRSPPIPAGSSLFSDDNSQFPAWFNLKDPIKEEEPLSAKEENTDNNVIVPPVGINRGNDHEQVQLDENNNDGPGPADPLDREEQEDNESIANPERSDSPRSDRWSDYDEDDDDIGEIPSFGARPEGQSTPIISPENAKPEPQGNVKTVVAEITMKVDSLAADNAALMIAQAKANDENKRLQDEIKRLTAAGQKTDHKSEQRASTARATSVLPPGSAVNRAIHGDRPGGGPSDPGDSDDGGKPPKKDPGKGKKPARKESTPDPDDSDTGDDKDKGDIFDDEPESDHASDSAGTKKRKRAARRRYRARIARLKYQQAFLKTTPPFIYNGEVQATLFKKWVREVRLWIEQGRLGDSEGVQTAGRFLAGRAYQFFERDVLALQKKYSLTEFFERLFNYVFPVDFRMQQRDKFDTCKQENRSVLDFLWKLQEIADMIGDMDDKDIILAFWRRSQPYLRVEMTKDGLDPTTMSLTVLEECAIRHERAHLLAGEEGKRGKTFTSRFTTSKHNNSSAASPIAPQAMIPSTSLAVVKRDNKDGKKPFSPNKRFGNKSNKDAERLKRLRAEGRCFECESREHLSKDCPQKTTKRPPIRLAAAELISPAEARLAAVEEGNKLGLFSALLEPSTKSMRENLIARAKLTLETAVPLTFDYIEEDAEASAFMEDRFEMSDWGCDESCPKCESGSVEIWDHHSYETHLVTYAQLADPSFDLVHWIHISKSEQFDAMVRKKRKVKWHSAPPAKAQYRDDDDPDSDDEDSSDLDHDQSPQKSACSIQVSAVQTARTNIRERAPVGLDTQSALERTAARVKSAGRMVPKPIVVVVNINGQPCRALLDSGSQSDFMSTTLVDQLKLPIQDLEKPLTLQLAVSGSRGKVKCLVNAVLAYQSVKEKRTFDVANLDSHDLILGLPFLVQHKLLLGFNPAQVTIRSIESVLFDAEQSVYIASRAAELKQINIDEFREELTQYASDICKEAIETPLPPLRTINHVIPLIDEHKVYSWCPSKCPELFKALWRSKRDDYIRTGRWEFRSGTNAVPMIMPPRMGP